jgi:hypothetical protein
MLSPYRSRGHGTLTTVLFAPLAPGDFPCQVGCALLIIWTLRDQPMRAESG